MKQSLSVGSGSIILKATFCLAQTALWDVFAMAPAHSLCSEKSVGNFH